MVQGKALVAMTAAAAMGLAACGGDPAPAANTPPATVDGTTPTSATSTPEGATPSTSAEPAQLPRGGSTLFPRYRLVGYSGAPGSKAFGRLGIGDLDDRADELERVAAGYVQGETGKTAQPVLELIATIATSGPGRDGEYRTRADDGTIRRYLDAARRHRALLLLGIQPGRADFLPEVKAYSRWLREPDVGLALDPEWAVGSNQVPGRVFGSTTGAELDQVARYVSELVTAQNLPEKAMVFHQLAPQVVRDEKDLRAHPGVVAIKSVDGIGSRQLKLDTWRRLTRALPAAIHPGFKLFYVEDTRNKTRLMTPAQVLALRPTPGYVLYE